MCDSSEHPKKQNRTIKSRVRGLLTGAGFVMMVFCMIIGPASANETSGVNWTQLTDVIDGFVGIVPSFASMIGAVMPILMTIAVYVFVLKFWDKLLAAIDSAFDMFKH